jgi:transposase-like protein
MIWLTECLYCHNFVYHLSDGRIKCSVCNKKISKTKVNKILTLLHSFVNDESAYQTAKRVHLSYQSVQKQFQLFRLLCATISEDEYEKVRHLSCEFEEYFYLEKSKKGKKEAIFDAHNFLTFDYQGHIYTLLMPSLQKYKHQLLQDNIEDTYIDSFKKFKRESKLIKLSHNENNIATFWNYFEQHILKYKGVQNDTFGYFLKEFEFKYNHTKEEAIELLIQYYFKD